MQSLKPGAARLVTASLGVALLGVALVSTLVSGHAAANQEVDFALRGQAAAAVDALEEYFERTRSLDLLLANDLAVRRFDPERSRDGDAPAHVTAEASAALAYLGQLYPGRIEEACVIDASGTELARVVRGEVAPAAELSTEEMSAPFFTPTAALEPGRVHQSSPYLSPDTGEWVVSNSTPVASASGRAWGMVHFEMSVDSFRGAVLSESPGQGFGAAIVDVRTGNVLLDSDAPLGRPTVLGRPSSPGLRKLLRQGDATVGTVGGERVAVAPVAALPDNDNTWAVVVTAPESRSGWARMVGPAPVALGLAAMMLLLFTGLSAGSAHRQVREASLTDELTGLPNRRSLTQHLDAALLGADRRGSAVAVLLVDLDRFKEVNDTRGHSTGDTLLQHVGQRLRDAVRGSDVVGRLSGDEFMIVLTDVLGEEAARESALRCLAALHQPFLINGQALDVEASIGVALAPAHGPTGGALLHSADVAMYEAKAGSTGVVVFDRSLDLPGSTRLALLGGLRRALREDELVMHYQPKVDLPSGQVRAVEALVRWQRPGHGLSSAAEFVPVVENSGLLLSLTLHTLELALRESRAWHEDGHEIQVAVNLSPRCLAFAELPDLVRDLLRKTGVPAGLLRLEVTESAIVADPTRALSVLQSLTGLGVSLSLDDFGTGYSSMTHLRGLPVDELKIDRSFVAGLLQGGSDAVLVRSCLDLGHDLGMTVVAEGVEDEATLTALVALGCDVAQGFHLARPMPSAELLAWLCGRRVLPLRTITGS